MALQITVVDAFTDKAFAGNPAAVAICEAFPSAERMQNIAAEMNLPETAFLTPRDDESFDLRWFSPTVEIPLCGHATLASTHVIGRSVSFHTQSGRLDCSRGDDGWIEMDFPANPPEQQRLPPAIDSPAISWFGKGQHFTLLELAEASTVRTLEGGPGLADRLGVPAIIVTAPSDRAGIDCVSRVFGPGLGIPEDPATGSAHCMLAVHWGDRLGKDELVGEQASPRGGIVGMRRAGDRVIFRGQAVTISNCEMVV